MEIIQTNISGVLIIEPRVFKDSRGYFFESLSKQEKAMLIEKDLKHACLKDAVLDFDINDKLYED